jgi:hypothetical protein
VQVVERVGRERAEPAEIPANRGRREDRPVRPRQPAGIAGDHQEVSPGDQVDLVGSKVLVNRGEHAHDQRVVQLVGVQPLAEDAALRQVPAHATVELGGEEPGHAADPRVRRLGQDEIVPPVLGSEV